MVVVGDALSLKRRLAERLDVSDKTVQRAIAKLEAEKLVRRVARHYSAGGQASNYYDLSPLVDRLKDIAGDFIEAREEARKAKRKAERPGLRNRKKAAEVES
ncbi:GntR family transcriptional regulator [Phenylobacterium sp. J367]|uniref:GntR family transcriptional regulator n=1 Tax=Phenylobacterium sp. J367 TaxID=2898435 RepID=UPI002150DD0D|nr:GntR family transcriptional regulator [Phenylobacterium sp. J367]MCR5877273.1 GntR family transcriptional regulator [Phenylobacterium sp. J367]